MAAAKELVRTLMNQLELERVKREAVDYYLPYEGTLVLLKKGLVKRNLRSAADEAIFGQDQDAQDVN